MDNRETIKNKLKADVEAFNKKSKTDPVLRNPDHFGTYSDFVTNSAPVGLKFDMPRIARLFCKNEFGNIDKYNEVQYWLLPRGDVVLENDIICQFMNIMFNAYKAGSGYADKLWHEIIKIYYKWGYSDLKRYSVITMNDLMNITIDYEYDTQTELLRYMSVLLVLAEMMNIQIDESCAYVYAAMNRLNNDFIENNVNSIKRIDVSDEASEKGDKWAEDYFGKYPCPTSWGDFEADGYHALGYANAINEAAFKIDGFGGNFANISLKGKYTPEEIIAWTASLVFHLYPDKEFTDEEIVSYATIVNLVFSYSETVIDVGNFMDVFLGMKTNNLENLSTSFSYEGDYFKKIEAISGENSAVKEEEAKPSLDITATDSDTKLLLAEIERLRGELHRKEANNRYIKELYSERLNKKDSYDKLLQKYEEEHMELTAIRNHLYNFTDEDIVQDNTSRDEIVKELQTSKVVIIGGHDNWIRKLKELFPKWKFIKPGSSENIDVNALEGIEYVFFFTDCLDHKTYYKYIYAIREHKIRFGYIHSVNIENNLAQFSKELR